MTNDTQIFKGILEGCLLKILSRGEIYGYKAVEALNRLGFEVNEATVYPILTRLQARGFLEIEKRPSQFGPNRKYYTLSPAGKVLLEEFEDTWLRLRLMVDQVMGDDHNDKEG